MNRFYLLLVLLSLTALSLTACVNQPTPSSEPSLTLSSTVTTRTNLDPFTLTVEIKNFPDVAKVEFFRGSDLIGNTESAPYKYEVTTWQFGVFSDTYTAKATNTSGVAISSSPLTINVNVPDALLVSPQESVMLAGGMATAFEAYLRTEDSSESISVNWTLEGPGSLSVPSGIRTEYTPPATLDAETTATVTGTLPDGRSARGVITLKPATPSGNLYSVNARVFGSSTDIFVTENSSSSPFPSAIVKVNGTTIPFAGGRFQGALPVAITAGETVNLEIDVPEGTIRATATMPAAPDLTAPANGSSLSAANPLELAWTMPASPSSYRLGYGTVPYESDLAVFANAPGENRTQTFTGIPANKTLNVFVIAINEVTEATGPTSDFALYAENSADSSRSTVTTTP